MKLSSRSLLFAAIALILITLNASLFTVDETQQALVVRLGKPVQIDVKPGLKIKLPFIDTTIYYDARLLSLLPLAEQIILGDQKRIEVDTVTRYRISDPLRFYQSLRSIDQAQIQLSQIVSSSMRRELGKVPLPTLLSEERVKVVQNIQREVTERAKPLGIDIVEVRIHRADLPFETSQAIYDRMKSERQREAKELRAQGFEWAQEIQAKAERERTIILSEAQKQSKIIKGGADAEANQLLANAFGKDPQFYRLYRSLQTYRQPLADSAPTLILNPDAQFLSSLKTGPTIQK